MDDDESFRDPGRFGDFEPAHLASIGLQLQSEDGFQQADGSDLIPAQINHYLPEAMHTLNLGFYKDRAGNILVGSNDERLHRHDRWLYAQPIGHRSWYQVAAEADQWFPMEESAPADPHNLAERIILTRNGYRGTDLTDYWLCYRIPVGVVPHVQTVLHRGNLTHEAMHNIIFHYYIWAARNPDYSELPREIAMRMLGFGPVLDALASLGMSLPQ